MSGAGAWVIPFGKYKGRALTDVPVPYLRWLLGTENLYVDTRQAIEAHLKEPRPTSSSPRQRSSAGKGKGKGQLGFVAPPSTCDRCGLPGSSERPLVHADCSTDDIPF